MEKYSAQLKSSPFYSLKIAKKEQLTKNVWSFELLVPEALSSIFAFQAGQYVPVQYQYGNKTLINDYSLTSAPFEKKITLGIKVNSPESSTVGIVDKNPGDMMEVGAPKGRFTVISKPHEFRTILYFAAGIGITPILSHLKNILHNEPRTRLFLFYGNRFRDEIAYKDELDALVKEYNERLQVYYFFSREKKESHLFSGRIDEHKLKLIINQILHLDDTDEESTIWDSVDEVLICGKGEMIRTLANACYENGIPKRNIHFELFEAFNEDIYPQEKDFPLINHIDVDFKILDQDFHATLADNRNRLLQSLLEQKFQVPYSCKSGICGSCQCRLLEGKVELLENEYLTEKEEENGFILACMSVILSKRIKVDFDLS